MAFYRSIGKKPIHVRKEVMGHATDRLQAALYREIAHLIANGVLDVADADAAVYWGVGPRWAAVGPSLGFHLAGGAGGIRHFVEHLGQTTTALDELEHSAAVPTAVQNAIVDAVLREAGDRSLEQLEHHRDEALLDLLRGRIRDRRARPSCSSKDSANQASTMTGHTPRLCGIGVATQVREWNVESEAMKRTRR